MTGGGIGATSTGQSGCGVQATCLPAGANYSQQVKNRLDCVDQQTTCNCLTDGGLTKTVPKEPAFCGSQPDAGTRPNVSAANDACGWGVDLSGWNH